MTYHKLAYRYWTREEEYTLREKYGKMPTRDLAKTLSRTPKAVNGKAALLGLHLVNWVKWSKDETREAISREVGISQPLGDHTDHAVRSHRSWLKKKSN